MTDFIIFENHISIDNRKTFGFISKLSLIIKNFNDIHHPETDGLQMKKKLFTCNL